VGVGVGVVTVVVFVLESAVEPVGFAILTPHAEVSAINPSADSWRARRTNNRFNIQLPTPD
jgi:hypothetical protein